MGSRIGDALLAETQSFQRRPSVPNPDPGEARIGVHRVVEPSLVTRPKLFAQNVAIEGEQRPHQRHSGEPLQGIRGDHPHRRKPVDAAATRQPEQERLRLVVARMTDIDRLQAVLFRPFAHQPIARLACRGFDVGARSLAFAYKKLRRQPRRLCLAHNFARFGGRFRTQGVIDAEHNRRRQAGLLRPIAQQEHQGQRIAAAGHRDRAGPRRACRRHRFSEARRKIFTTCRTSSARWPLARGPQRRHSGICF